MPSGLAPFPALRCIRPEDREAVRALVFETLREFGFPPDPAGEDADLDDPAMSYLARGGAFEVLLDGGGRLIGCFGLYPVDAERVELRKMYLRPEARGRGLGRRLLERAVARARALGFRCLELQTATILATAVAMYTRRGFTPFEPQHRVPGCDTALRLVLRGQPTA